MSLKRQMLLNTIGTVFYLGCQWLMSVLVVRMSGYETAGKLTLAISITNIFSVIALFTMRQYQVSDLENQYEDSTYIVSRYITSLLALIMCTLYVGFSLSESDQILCVLAYMIIKVTEALVDVYHGILQKNIRYDLMCISYVIRGVFTLGIFVIVLWRTGNLALTLLIIAVILLIVCITYDRKKIDIPLIRRSIINWGNLKELLKVCFPLVIFNFIVTYIPILPRLLYQTIYGTDKLGVYGAVSAPTMVINVVAVLIFNPLIPVVKKVYQERNKKHFHILLLQIMGFVVIMGLVAIILIKLLGNIVLVFLFGDSIVPYIWILEPIVLSAIVIAAVWIISNVLITIRKIKELMVISVSAFLLELLFVKHILIQWEMNGISYCAILFLGIIVALAFAVAWFGKAREWKNA